MIDVIDTGIGIAPDEIQHVWDRLFRGRRSRHEPGLGLGRPVVGEPLLGPGEEVRVVDRPLHEVAGCPVR